MEEGNELEAHSAAQGLLDFANTATASRSSLPARRGSEQAKSSSTGKDFSGSPAASPRLAVATVTSTGHGRLITSGNNPLLSRQSQDSGCATKQGESRKTANFRQPAPRRPEAPERVTVIVQRLAQDKAGDSAEPATSTCDVPVPASAFASLIGSGDSGKSSTDFTPFSALTAAKEVSGSDGETESDEKGEIQERGADCDDSNRPLKKRKLTRTVSINAVLQRVGSKEAPLADAVGLAPQTVQEIVPRVSSKVPGKPDASMDTLEIVEKLWGSGRPQPTGPSLPLKSGATERGPSEGTSRRKSSKGFKRELSVERALHLPPKPPAAAAAVIGKATNGDLGAGVVAQSAPAAAVKDNTEDTPQSALWAGKVKHRLRTAEGSSVVELFDLTALIPEKLLEQMPPTLFVSALAGRANVKLGKHFVTQCRLETLGERQRQKALALAGMKLVAICELQHCSLTLVPFTDGHQELRIVGFMIADD